MYCKYYLNLHLACLVCKIYSIIINAGSRVNDLIMKNFFICATMLLGIISSELAADLNTARIDEITGLKGKVNEKEGVYKVTFPRDDVKIVVDGWTMPPFMGLGTWAAFTKGAHTEAMVMGDTVLFEDEVNAAMSASFDNVLRPTTLPHLLFSARNNISFTHIES